MITIKLPCEHKRLFSRESAADFSYLAARYESAVMFLHGNRTINGKSLLGLLSFGNVQNGDVYVAIDGADEAEAEAAIRDFFHI